MSTTPTQPPSPHPDQERDHPAAIAQARAAVEQQRGVLAEWEAKAAVSTAELASMQERAGEELLDNPDLEDELAASIGTLQARIALAKRAVVAQQPRVIVAERAYLLAEADALEPVQAAAQQALRDHHAKTEELLAQLEAHEGEYISKVEHFNALLSLDVLFDQLSCKIPKSLTLRRAEFQARCHIAVLREMAAGGDPVEMLRQPDWRRFLMTDDFGDVDTHPACVKGPDAVVHPRSYFHAVEQLRNRVSELEALALRLPTEIADWEQRLASGAPQAASPTEPQVSQEGIELRCARLERIEDDLIVARQTLHELTGEVSK